MDTNPVITSALEYARTKFGANLDCVFISGSQIDGTASPTSDLDMVILCRAVPNSYRYCETHDDRPYDVKVYDFDTIMFELNYERTVNTNALLPFLLTHSIMVPDNSENGMIARNMARRMMEEGPTPPQSLLDVMRHDLSNMIGNLRRDDISYEEKVPVMLHSYATAGHLLLLHKKSLTYGGKWLYRTLKKLASDDADALQSGLETFFRTRDPAPYADTLQAILVLVGGPLGDSYRVDNAPNRRLKLNIPLMI